MIGKSTGINAVVWNIDFGYGKFKGWEPHNQICAYVQFEDCVRLIPCKMLTEIDDQ